MSVRWLLGCGLIAWLCGCEGNVAVGDRVKPTPACLDYCAAVTKEKDCFTIGDCHARCMALYSSDCTSETEAALGCLPARLDGTCQIIHSDLPDACTTALDDSWACNISAIDGCSSDGAQLVGETACEGHATCEAGELAIACTETAECTCFVEGDPVAECAMPFTGTEACSLAFTCCRPVFGL